MKRSTGLARVVPLKPDRPLERTTELGRGLPLRRTAPATMRRWRYTGPPDDVRALLIARSGGLCEIGVVCDGMAEGVDPSHRIAKGAGGSSLAATNAVTNQLWSCRGCHAHVEAEPLEAYAAGWKIRHGSVDPATVPVMLAGLGGGATVWLDPSGGYSTAPPAPEVPGV